MIKLPPLKSELGSCDHSSFSNFNEAATWSSQKSLDLTLRQVKISQWTVPGVSYWSQISKDTVPAHLNDRSHFSLPWVKRVVFSLILFAWALFHPFLIILIIMCEMGVDFSYRLRILLYYMAIYYLVDEAMGYLFTDFRRSD